MQWECYGMAIKTCMSYYSDMGEGGDVRVSMNLVRFLGGATGLLLCVGACKMEGVQCMSSWSFVAVVEVCRGVLVVVCCGLFRVLCVV